MLIDLSFNNDKLYKGCRFGSRHKKKVLETPLNEAVALFRKNFQAEYLNDGYVRRCIHHFELSGQVPTVFFMVATRLLADMARRLTFNSRNGRLEI